MKNKSIKKDSLSANLAFQFLYQVIIFVIPLIIAPYLTRKLQKSSLGIYSFVHSISYYFVLAANLGIVKHGQRVISTNSDDEDSLRRTFWSLFVTHIIFSLLSLFAYFIYISFIVKDYKDIYLIEGLYVLSALFDLTWLYYGLENFKLIVVRNSIIKLIECVFIFGFVKTPDDLPVYTIITALSFLLSQAIMLPNAMKTIKPKRITWRDCASHIKPLLFFSISVIAISLYTVFDKTLLGILSQKENVAFYEYSNRIINIPRTLIGVIGTIMFPRACKLAAKGDIKGQKKYMMYSFLFTIIIGFGSVFGLLSISKPFSVLYYGESFEVCGRVIMELSPLILIVGLGDIIRTQYMIPNHMDKQYTICIVLNAVINIILTVIFIPILGISGAVIGTVSAELFGFIFQSWICRKSIKLKDYIFPSLYFALNGVVMMLVIMFMDRFILNSYVGLLIKVVLGLLIYTIGIVIFFYCFKRDLLIELLHIKPKYNKT